MTILLQRNICISWPSRVLVYKNSATTFRMTILFFCTEIYAQSQPRRVLLYKNRAITFRMTILFFCMRNIYLVLAKACYITLKQRIYLSDDNLIQLLQRNICIFLAKPCFSVQKQRDYLSDDNLILLYRNICLVLAKACFTVQKQRDYLSDDNLILLYRNICLSCRRRVLVYKNTPFRMTILYFVQKYMLSLSQGVLYCTKISDYLG